MRNIYKFIFFLIIISSLSLILLSCAGNDDSSDGHEHTYESAWTYDEAAHWHKSTCDHPNEKKEYFAHKYDNWEIIEEADEDKTGSQKRECMICGYIDIVIIPKVDHLHTYIDVWEYDNVNHWHISTCETHPKSIIHLKPHDFSDWKTIIEVTDEEDGLVSRECLTCDYYEEKVVPKVPHEHRFSEDYGYNDIAHWHYGICGHDDVIMDYDYHKLSDWHDVIEPGENSRAYRMQECICGYNIKEYYDYEVKFYATDGSLLKTLIVQYGTVLEKISELDYNLNISYGAYIRLGYLTESLEDYIGFVVKEDVIFYEKTVKLEFSDDFDQDVAINYMTYLDITPSSYVESLDVYLQWQLTTSTPFDDIGDFNPSLGHHQYFENIVSSAQMYIDNTDYNLTGHFNLSYMLIFNGQIYYGKIMRIEEAAVYNFDNTCPKFKVVNFFGEELDLEYGMVFAEPIKIIVSDENEGFTVVTEDGSTTEFLEFVYETSGVHVIQAFDIVGNYTLVYKFYIYLQINVSGTTPDDVSYENDCITLLYELNIIQPIGFNFQIIVESNTSLEFSAQTEIVSSDVDEDRLEITRNVIMTLKCGYANDFIPGAIQFSVTFYVQDSVFKNIVSSPYTFVPSTTTNGAFTERSKNAFDDYSDLKIYLIGNDEYFSYYINETKDACYIQDFSSNEKEIWIPKEFRGIPVIGIAPRAFQNAFDLETIYIPNSIKEIGSSAFVNCINLVNVYFDGSIEEWCQIDFAKHTYSASYFANPMSVTDNFFFKKADEYIQLIDLEISSLILEIGDYQFVGLKALERVNILDGATRIGNSAFEGCYNLVEVILPDSVIYIEQRAFEFCDNLNNIVFGSDNIMISQMAFYGCAFSELIIRENIIRIAFGAFANNVNLTKISIYSAIPTIESCLFYNCYNLNEVMLPETITIIFSNAFYNATVEKIYTRGNSERWSQILFENDGNDCLNTAIVYYFSPNTPLEAGDYWYEDEFGNILIWA